jgi:O-acetyl-ADP-ribose deacetylase (regulator of RNase III)
VASIAMPAISSGIYGMPKDVSARVLIRATAEYLRQHPQSTLRTVQFCNIDEVTVKAFVAQAPLVLGEESQ